MSDTGLMAGKYQLLRRIAQGGMAEVYLARQTGLEGFEKLVVIKRILPHLVENDEFVRMFLDEARTAADLRHSNVVQIYEIGEDQGTYFIAMEFLHGQDVRRVMRRQAEMEGPVPLPHALQIVVDAAHGLDHAHKKSDLHGRPLGIIHRDISPQNIIVTYDGTTKIVDFGIAKAASQSTHTASGVLKGKYSYMSPEQASGTHLDQRTDQFALGIVLYELVTMSRLFKQPNEIMTLHAIIESDIPDPRTRVPSLPPRLADIVMQALAKDREDRFADCRQMAEALEEFLAEERMVHSPTRLGSYVSELFRAQLEQEKALGMPVLELEQSSSGAGAAPTKGGRRPPPGATPPRAERTGGSKGSKSGRVADVDPDLQNAGTQVTSALEAPPAPTRTSMPTGSRGGRKPAPVDESTTDLATTGGTASAVREMHQGGSRLFVAGLALVGVLGATAGGAYYALQGGTGPLVVRTQPPGATVSVDGHPAPEPTPTIIKDLEVGHGYAVRVELPGYVPAVRQVKLERDDGQELSVTLEKDTPRALLRLKSTPPGARVYLDGRALEGVTPLDLPAIPVDADQHDLLFSLAGHVDETRRVALREGTVEVTVTLAARSADEPRGRLSITSDPPGAAITVGGRPVGNAPLSGLEVTGGTSHAVVARLAGHEPQEQLVDVPRDGAVDVVFQLEKERPAEFGYLTLDSKPEASVFTDKGRSLGRTPLKRARVPAGTLTLRLVGEREGFEHVEKLKVETEQEVRRTVAIPRGNLKVVVGSWAHVYVNGVKRGTTPMKPLSLYVGRYEVRLVNDKLGKDEKETVVIRAGDDARVRREW